MYMSLCEQLQIDGVEIIEMSTVAQRVLLCVCGTRCTRYSNPDFNFMEIKT